MRAKPTIDPNALKTAQDELTALKSKKSDINEKCKIDSDCIKGKCVGSENNLKCSEGKFGQACSFLKKSAEESANDLFTGKWKKSKNTCNEGLFCDKNNICIKNYMDENEYKCIKKTSQDKLADFFQGK